MSPQRSITTCFAKYVQFSGRAPISEYWWFTLFTVLGIMITGILDRVLFGVGDMMANGYQRGLLRPVFQLAVLLPSLAVGWRRLHDSGRPGWYLLIPTIALTAIFAFTFLGLMGFLNMQNSYSMMRGNGGLMIIGLSLLVLLVVPSAIGVSLYWLTRPSQPIPNKYGPNPHEVTS